MPVLLHAKRRRGTLHFKYIRESEARAGDRHCTPGLSHVGLHAMGKSATGGKSSAELGKRVQTPHARKTLAMNFPSFGISIVGSYIKRGDRSTLPQRSLQILAKPRMEMTRVRTQVTI